MGFVGNLLGFPAVKEFWKSVKNWQSYCHEFGVQFFGPPCRGTKCLHPFICIADCWLSLTKFFELNTDNSTRGHPFKLVKHRCNCEVRRHFFPERVVNRWNMLDQDTVSAKTVNGIKSKLELERKRNMGLFLDWSLLGLMAVFNLLERPNLWVTCEFTYKCLTLQCDSRSRELLRLVTGKIQSWRKISSTLRPCLRRCLTC